MNRTIRLISKRQVEEAIKAIQTIGFDETHVVEIREDKETRSGAQNRLYWVWVSEISKHTGESKSDVHTRYKKDLARIYERDDAEYAEMIESVREVYRQGMKEQAKHLQREIIKLTSTTKATVEQFTEYLNLIEIDSAQNGIVLSRPEDLYRTALGV